MTIIVLLTLQMTNTIATDAKIGIYKTVRDARSMFSHFIISTNPQWIGVFVDLDEFKDSGDRDDHWGRQSMMSHA